MALPVGIENFAAGLVQGMSQRKADKRLEAQDQRQSEQDAMRKQEFDLQQQARTLDIQNAQNRAANEKIDRERALRLQARGDAFNSHLSTAYSLMGYGDNDGTILSLAKGFNDPAFGMPYKAVPQTDPYGKLVKDKDGKYVIGYADHSGKLVSTQAWTPQEALQGFRGINDAAGQFDKALERERRSEEKAADNIAAMERLQAQYDLSDRNASRQAARVKDLVGFKAKNRISSGASPGKDYLSADGMGLFKVRVVTGKTEDGVPIISTVLDQKKFGEFHAWAKKNSLQPNDKAAQRFLGTTQPDMAPAAAPQDDQSPTIDYSELN